jgi:hypothetical protein
LGTFSGTATLTLTGVFNIDFTLVANAIKTCAIGKYYCAIDWNAEFSTGENSYLGRTIITVYVLPTVPSAPFSTVAGAESNWLSVGLLELASSYLEQSGHIAGRAAFAPRVRSDARLTPSDSAQYSTLTEGEITVTGYATFNLNSFLTAYETGRATVGALDAALLLALLCRAYGGTANLCQLKSGLPKDYYFGYNLTYLPFMLSSVKRLTETEASEDCWVDNHYIVCDSATIDYTMSVSDPYYSIRTLEGQMVYPDNLSYSDTETFFIGDANPALYRETLCALGSMNAIWQVTNNISFGRLASSAGGVI